MHVRSRCWFCASAVQTTEAWIAAPSHASTCMCQRPAQCLQVRCCAGSSRVLCRLPLSCAALLELDWQGCMVQAQLQAKASTS